MTNFVFNVAKGSVAYYCTLPGASDSLIAVPLETTGVEADSVLRDYDSLAQILAGSSNEQTDMGRKTLAGVTRTVDDANDRVDCDVSDILWSAATGNPVNKVIICYKPTSSSVDSDIIPLTGHDFVVTPNGGDISALVSATGFYRAS